MRASAQGSIAGTVYDSLRTRAPLADATVVLVEKSRYATTDSRGRFSFDSVPDGHYTVGFTHAVLDSLDLQGPIVAVDVAGARRASVLLTTPSSRTMYARLCPSVHDTTTGMVIGRVRDVDAQTPIADAAVSTDWTEYTLRGGHTSSTRMRAATRTNAGGLYLLCGVPTDVPLDVQSELGGIVAGPTPLSMEGRLFSRVDFAISRKDSAARTVVTAASHVDSGVAAPRTPGTASLRGTVLGADGKPLHDATVSVAGTDRSVRSGADGTFRVDQIPAGTRTIEVKAIGLLPVTFSVDFATRSVRDTTVSVTRVAQELKSVTVEGKTKSGPWMALSGFDDRRQHALGNYVTADEIKQHNYVDMAQILRTVSGVKVDCAATKGLQGVPCRPVVHMLGITDYKSVGCIPNYFLDGAPFPSGYSDLNASILIASIKGIEVYTNPGSIPAQFDLESSTGCGSIVIWTH
jgi:hypothetical protein